MPAAEIVTANTSAAQGSNRDHGGDHANYADHRHRDGDQHDWEPPATSSGQAQHLPEGDRSLFLYVELLPAQDTGKVTLGTEGEGDDVVVFGLGRLDDLEGHGDIREIRTVGAGLVSGRSHRQDPGLVEGDVAESFPFGGKLKLFFLLLALVFGQCEPPPAVS